MRLRAGTMSDESQPPVVSVDRVRGNEHKLRNIKFNVNIRKLFFTMMVIEQWNRLIRGVVVS